MSTWEVINNLRDLYCERDASKKIDDACQLLIELDMKLEYQTKLTELAEHAMNTCAEASRGFEKIANKYFDYKEPLERVVDSARLFVATQDTLAPGDFAGDKFEDLKQELSKVRDWTKS